MIRLLGTIFAGLFGLAFGSFLNVCASRWPEGESVVRPASHCRACGRALRWWENLPVLSWMALRGRCRTCNARIGLRYVLVEMSLGGCWAYIAWRALAPAGTFTGSVSFSPELLLERFGAAALCLVLIGLAAVDAEHLWLPDAVTLPGIACGVLLHLGMAAVGPNRGSVIASSLLGAAAGATLIVVIRMFYWAVRRREGIGLGDAKLMALLGAWLGITGMLLAFVIGVILGGIAGVWVLARPRTAAEAESRAVVMLPLGTFLCIGGVISALWGEPILRAYLHWIGL